MNFFFEGSITSVAGKNKEKRNGVTAFCFSMPPVYVHIAEMIVQEHIYLGLLTMV